MASLRDTLSMKKAKRMGLKAARESTSARDPTVINPRVWHMFKEAIEFKANTVSPFQSEVGGLERMTLELFDGVLPLLHAPLPRVWEMVDGGLAEPIRATVSHNFPHIAGGDLNENAMLMSVTEYEERLQLGVRRPLAQWVEALENVRARIPELERLRALFEKRTASILHQEQKAEKEARDRAGVRRGSRKAVPKQSTRPSGLFASCTHPAADPMDELTLEERTDTLSGGPGGEEGQYHDAMGNQMMAREFKAEERAMKLSDRQRKLEAARDAFLAEENLLYEQLSGLCRDASWTKSYIAASMVMTKELFQESIYNMGECLQPIPGCKSQTLTARGAGAPAGEMESGRATPDILAGSVSGDQGYLVPGQLASNMGYAVAMPDYATRARARSTLDQFKALSSRRAQTHKATSQPLELHAVLDAKPSDRVPSARRGMTDRPLSSVAEGGLRGPLDSLEGHMGHSRGLSPVRLATGATTPMSPVTPLR